MTVIYCLNCQQLFDTITPSPRSFTYCSLAAFDPNPANLNIVPARLEKQKEKDTHGTTLVPISQWAICQTNICDLKGYLSDKEMNQCGFLAVTQDEFKALQSMLVLTAVLRFL